MHTVKLSADVTVASQPDLADFRDVAAEGYVAVINNRPDGEDPTQPGSEAEEAACEEAGLAYAHIPVGPLTESTVRHFQSVVKGADGAVLVHCRSGTRSANLWAIGEVLDGRMVVGDLGRCPARSASTCRAPTAGCGSTPPTRRASMAKASGAGRTSFRFDAPRLIERSRHAVAFPPFRPDAPRPAEVER